MPRNEPSDADKLAALDIEIITVTRSTTPEGFEIAINHDGVTEDATIAILNRAVLLVCSMWDEEEEEEEEDE